MKKIFFDPSQALLNLFGEETALSEHALVHFALPLPAEPAEKKGFIDALENEFKKLDVVGTRISHQNTEIQVSIPLTEMQILDGQLAQASASPESKGLAKILSVFRDTHTPLAVEIPVTPGDHARDIANLNAHFQFNPPMTQAQNTDTPAITIDADSFNTLLHAWQTAAPPDASQKFWASQLEMLLEHQGKNDVHALIIAQDLNRGSTITPEAGFAERVGKERSNGDVIPFRSK